MEVNNKNTQASRPVSALIYLRTTTERDRDSEQAIAMQRRACEQRAWELGATIAEKYVDHARFAQTLKTARIKLIIATMTPAQQRFAETLSDCVGALASEQRRAVRRTRGAQP